MAANGSTASATRQASPQYLDKRTRWPTVDAPAAGLLSTGRRCRRRVCFPERRDGDGAELLENIGVSVGTASRAAGYDGKIAQSNQPYALGRRRRFYLAVRGLDSPAPSVRYSRARQSTPDYEIRRSRDLATNRPSACSAAVGGRALRASDLRKSPPRASLVEALSTGDPTVAVSLQRVRPTSRVDIVRCTCRRSGSVAERVVDPPSVKSNWCPPAC